MRSLSCRVAEAYLAQREALGYPWMKNASASESTQIEDNSGVESGDLAEQSMPFLFEIGTEELPVNDLEAAIAQLRKIVPETLEESRLEYNGISIQGTPRRLVVMISDLAGRQRDEVEIVKGPPADRAFDSEGAPTKAAQGFAPKPGH